MVSKSSQTGGQTDNSQLTIGQIVKILTVDDTFRVIRRGCEGAFDPQSITLEAEYLPEASGQLFSSGRVAEYLTKASSQLFPSGRVAKVWLEAGNNYSEGNIELSFPTQTSVDLSIYSGNYEGTPQFTQDTYVGNKAIMEAYTKMPFLDSYLPLPRQINSGESGQGLVAEPDQPADFSFNNLPNTRPVWQAVRKAAGVIRASMIRSRTQANVDISLN